MKDIIKVRCNDEEYETEIQGKYIDLVTGVVHLIKAISKGTDVEVSLILDYINSYLEDDDIEMEKISFIPTVEQPH